MSPDREKGVWFWGTLILSCITILTFIFLAWELLEQRFFSALDFRQIHYLYITRVVASSLILAGWAVWFVLRERRKSEDELRRSWKRYQAMLAHAADAIVLFDGDLRVLEWNPRAASLYGYSRDEILRQPLPTLGSAEEQELRSLLRQRTRSDPAIALETKRRNRNGEWIDVGIHLTSFPDVETGQTVFLEIASDYREKIRLRQRALEIEKLTSMGRLAAGTAHTLNTPLGAMLLRIEMLKDRLSEPGYREELERLESSTRFCQDFVQKLLQYSRSSDAALKCVDVGELLDSICTFFRPTFALRKQNLCWVCEHLHKSHILADRNHMEALFAALLMNALDAVSVDGRVCVDGSLRDGSVDLFVRDNGCGVPTDALHRIFEPFFTTKQSGEGTGLGLSIARNIVEEHGGNIGLANNREGGVTVRVSLPLCRGQEHRGRCTNPVCAAGGEGAV